jgi:hypothetical protein
MPNAASLQQRPRANAPASTSRSQTSQGTLFSVLNALEDHMDQVEIRHSVEESFTGQWWVLEENGTWRATTPRRGPGRLEFDLDVPPLRGRFLRHLSFDRS